MPIFPCRKAQNSQTRQLQTLLDAYTYSTSDSVPTKTFKVHKIHSDNDLRKLAKPHFCSSSSSSSSSIELAYRQSGTSTLDGFYTKRLLSVPCVILDQEKLHKFTPTVYIKNFPLFVGSHFLYVTCTHFVKKGGA